MKNLLIIFLMIPLFLSSQDDMTFEDVFKDFASDCCVSNVSLRPVVTDKTLFDFFRTDFVAPDDNNNYMILDKNGSIVWPKRSSCSDEIVIYFLSDKNILSLFFDYDPILNESQEDKVERLKKMLDI